MPWWVAALGILIGLAALAWLKCAPDLRRRQELLTRLDRQAQAFHVR